MTHTVDPAEELFCLNGEIAEHIRQIRKDPFWWNHPPPGYVSQTQIQAATAAGIRTNLVTKDELVSRINFKE